MSTLFFDKPILNSPCDYPSQHWELDETGQPTQKVIESRRQAQFITPIPKPKKRKAKDAQPELELIPSGMMSELEKCKIVITVFEQRQATRPLGHC